ncbi:MAG TPA: S-methyl-5'-thioadenosine phosphorylase, partial [Proteobacteria bacterium]|nr:S-methyl-5'-thioadenosine phosphorylase [Pseudomonadota bacterium]
VCLELADVLYEAGKKVGAPVVKGGTYLCIEGAPFSTKAESTVWRDMKADVIGMTNAPEAKLAREAELCYATLALSTDYDCWYERAEVVTVEMVMETMAKNIDNAKKIVREAVKMIPKERTCACKDALKFAIVTDPKYITEEAKRRYELLIGKYIS